VTTSVALDKVMCAMGASFGDLDNDGWLDFYVATGDPDFRSVIPNRVFRSLGGTRFEEVTTPGGFGVLTKGHGVSFGDFDEDGDQDIFANMGGMLQADVAPSVLFRNPGFGNRWITLVLEGVRANRAAIGARIEVVVDLGTGTRSIHRVVSSGGSLWKQPAAGDRARPGAFDPRGGDSVAWGWGRYPPECANGSGFPGPGGGHGDAAALACNHAKIPGSASSPTSTVANAARERRPQSRRVSGHPGQEEGGSSGEPSAER
jgi:hypothetical protein